MRFNSFLLIAGVFMLCNLAAETAEDPVQHECKRISDKLASVDYQECLDRKFELTGGRSVKDAPILIKEYPPLPERRTPIGRVLLFGGIHGDEYSSVSIVFKWMNILDQHHSGLFHWHIVPLLNPDGLLQENSQRGNANGVDLNRNFPTSNWEEESERYWTEKTDRNPRRYPGENALSEPEAQWLVKEIESFKPDVIVTIHAPHGVVDYDGPPDGPYKLGRLYLGLLGTYPGSLGRYAGIQKQISVVTVELPYSGIMPKPGEISDIWKDLINWLIRHLPANTQTAEHAYETDPS
ncbi:MAG: murein peptide amidase A [Gammaproteobacteria bacterium]|nr:murein peptide amidase A [Gammaproteobacteria bacterium]